MVQVFVLDVDKDDLINNIIEKNDQYTLVSDVPEILLKSKFILFNPLLWEVIRNRIDVLGTAEPEIYPEGKSRIVVRLPGADAQQDRKQRIKFQKMQFCHLN